MENKHTFYRNEFHKWIIDEWTRKGTPEVRWMYQKIGHFQIRLWRHERGKYYFIDMTNLK